MPRTIRPVLFVGPGSDSCLESIRLLSEEKVDYDQHDVSRDRVALNRLIKHTGRTEVPAFVWGADVIANFRTWELRRFVKQHRNAEG